MYLVVRKGNTAWREVVNATNKNPGDNIPTWAEVYTIDMGVEVPEDVVWPNEERGPAGCQLNVNSMKLRSNPNLAPPNPSGPPGIQELWEAVDALASLAPPETKAKVKNAKDRSPQRKVRS